MSQLQISVSAPVSSTAAAAPLPPAAVTVINIPAERPGPVWSQAQGNVDTFCSKIVRPPTLLHSSHPPAAALNLKLVKIFMICPGQWWWYWLWYWWWWWPHGGHQLLCSAQQQLSAWCLAGELQLCFAAQLSTNVVWESCSVTLPPCFVAAPPLHCGSSAPLHVCVSCLFTTRPGPGHLGSLAPAGCRLVATHCTWALPATLHSVLW